MMLHLQEQFVVTAMYNMASSTIWNHLRFSVIVQVSTQDINLHI